VQCSVEHGLQGRPVVEGIVCNQNASRYHARDNGFIALQVNLLLGIEKAEPDFRASLQMFQHVTVNKVHHVTYFCRIKGLPG
jgi:hypothetical protein